MQYMRGGELGRADRTPDPGVTAIINDVNLRLIYNPTNIVVL